MGYFYLQKIKETLNLMYFNDIKSSIIVALNVILQNQLQNFSSRGGLDTGISVHLPKGISVKGIAAVMFSNKIYRNLIAISL